MGKAITNEQAGELTEGTGQLPCNYSPPIDDYCIALVRPEDFKSKKPRKKADGTRGPSKMVIKRPGEAAYDSANGYWIYRTVDLVDGEKVRGEWFKVKQENLEFS